MLRPFTFENLERNTRLFRSSILLLFLLVNFAALAGQSAPESALNEAWQCPINLPIVGNPIAPTAESISNGKQLFFSDGCVDCHGEKGFGDGPAAKSLNPSPTNFHSRRTQDESDACLFWKLTTGRRPMPATKNVPERQRWDIINYIRGLQSE